MRIRGYVSICPDGSFYFSNNFGYGEHLKAYTFELEVPHPLVELKAIPESVEEVEGGEEKT